MGYYERVSMKRSPIRVFGSWLIALALVTASPEVCSCITGGASEACSSHSNLGTSRATEHCSTGASAASRAHPAAHACDQDGSCACGCSLAKPDFTLPAATAMAAPTVEQFIAIPEPCALLYVGVAEPKQPGFFGCDSGPPVPPVCLFHPSRAPPRA